MTPPGREGFFRRLGRALSGVNAVEYGRPAPTGDVDAPPGPVPALVVDDPGRADDPGPGEVPYPPDLPAGAKVIYTGPEHGRLLEHLVVEHPGVVADAGEKHADVRWVDKRDWFVNEGVFDPRDLTVVDERDFAARADRLRCSEWPGFSDEAPGDRRGDQVTIEDDDSPITPLA